MMVLSSTKLHLFLILIKISLILTDSNCIINNLEASSCDTDINGIKVYNFTSPNITIIQQNYFEIPSQVSLHFMGPVEISENTVVHYNCLQTNYFDCVQILTESSLHRKSRKILVNINVSPYPRNVLHGQFFEKYTSTNDSLSPELANFYANFSGLETGESVAYYNHYTDLYFKVLTQPVSQSIDLNITTNCVFFFGNIMILINSSGVPEEYIYHYKSETDEYLNLKIYIFIRIYPFGNENYTIDNLKSLFTYDYMKTNCVTKYQDEILKYSFNSPIPTPSPAPPTQPPPPPTNTPSNPNVSMSNKLQSSILIPLLIFLSLITTSK